MTIILPKELRNFQFAHVMPVTFNTFDVDILLPALFGAVVRNGNSRGSKPDDSTKVRDYIKELSEHESLEGFKDKDGQRALERLVRTSVVQMGRKGQSRRTEQILGLTGYTLLTFKAGYPEERLSRGVERLIHRMLRDALRGDDAVRKVFEATFGRGLKMTYHNTAPDGHYDGTTNLDTITLLTIAFLDRFESKRWKSAQSNERDAIPAVSREIASDLRLYLTTYHDRMPPEAFTYNFKALINFELFIYTEKLYRAIVDLVQDPLDLPPAMRDADRDRESSPPDLYLDFTGERRGTSYQIAGACVRRDLEMIQRFIGANLALRQMHEYVKQMKAAARKSPAIAEVAAMEAEGGPRYLQAMLLLRHNEQVTIRIDPYASADEQQIHAIAENDPEEIDRIAGTAETEFDRIVVLMAEGQRKTATGNLQKWHQSVAGLTKPFGMLQGVAKNRSDWRYAPSNDLLAVLVQLAAVDIPKNGRRDCVPESISLLHFLAWLEDRFGILVNRPPKEFESVDATAAAKENLAAMLGRLQQMGVFRDLSDDFTVQRLVPPYVATHFEEELA